MFRSLMRSNSTLGWTFSLIFALVFAQVAMSKPYDLQFFDFPDCKEHGAPWSKSGTYHVDERGCYEHQGNRKCVRFYDGKHKGNYCFAKYTHSKCRGKNKKYTDCPYSFWGIENDTKRSGSSIIELNKGESYEVLQESCKGYICGKKECKHLHKSWKC